MFLATNLIGTLQPGTHKHTTHANAEMVADGGGGDGGVWRHGKSGLATTYCHQGPIMWAIR